MKAEFGSSRKPIIGNRHVVLQLLAWGFSPLAETIYVSPHGATRSNCTASAP
jgi:hypothetical protein